MAPFSAAQSRLSAAGEHCKRFVPGRVHVPFIQIQCSTAWRRVAFLRACLLVLCRALSHPKNIEVCFAGMAYLLGVGVLVICALRPGHV